MDVTPPSTFAMNRPMQFVAETPAIETAWNRTQQTLQQLSERLNSSRGQTAISTVYVAGSLGRMEQVAGSDADVVVIVDDSIATDSVEATAARDAVWRELIKVGLPRPKTTGIFATVDTAARLCDPSTRGVIDEDMGVFGRRFQMLLDSQPIYAPNTFRELQSAVLDRYASDHVAQDAGQPWSYLLSDLIRYWRSLRVRTQWIEAAGEWRIINTKLRHSRLINYAGLLLLLGECSKRPDAVDWLKLRMPWTALERVAAAFTAYDDSSINEIVTAYDRFLSAMNDETTFTALNDSSTKTLETAEYLKLKSNSDSMFQSLLGFVMRRTGDWPDRFYECLIF